MKASEVLRQVEALQKCHGDLEVWISINGEECRSLDKIFFANGKQQHPEIEKPGFVVVKM